MVFDVVVVGLVLVGIEAAVSAELMVKPAEGFGTIVAAEVTELVCTTAEVGDAVALSVAVAVGAVVACGALHHVPEQTPQFAAD
jgi:hypothetical protein